ncbi:TIM-barrel domain-containing protein [Persicobacter diffluens]|uniref:Alpha-xylosidase n=1 Tax=Persicobacter diffluens TaxID=981 RepID=A0AAN4W2K0_9BACT|nr:alpha-xylosidase [Persicobacter diffluens]
MKNWVLILGFLWTVFSCGGQQAAFKQEKNQITFDIQSASVNKLRLSLITEDIVKVEATKNADFDAQESLIEINHGADFSDYSVKEAADGWEVKTKTLIVKVSTSGEVAYFNADGTAIISEKARNFEPMQVDGVSAYELRQQFNSPKQEALYGLGQHQADEMNYKGKNEELFQYNTKVSIPFVMSTQKYGVLWDNYSLTRFGDPRPYAEIDQFKLFDKEGKEGGLTATYGDLKKKDHVYAVRSESTIDYENLETVEKFPAGVNFDQAIITWEGELEADQSGEFKFLCYYAGYTKLWIDGELQFHKWRTAWNPSVAKFSVDMEKGKRRHIKLEWLPDGGISYIGLKALSPVDQQEQQDLSFYSEMGQDIRYYFMKGDNMDEVISHYRTVTGKAQVMPKWSMGFWQSRERYKTQEELLEALREFRKRQIPIDNIVLDWSYWPQDAWGSHDFDLDRFPDISAMTDEIHKNHARVMISVWPKFYETTENFKAFDQNGWMYRRAIDDQVKDWIAHGYVGSFYDAYAEGARKLFWKQIQDKLYTKGFDAWWMDASEPDILSNASMQYRKDLMNPTALGPSTQYFNAFALMNAKGIYEGQREVNNDDRVFILTRSGFAGLQNYGAVTWSGDIGTRWEDMKAQISAGINFAMSGLPYWTMDVGGFCVEKRYEVAKEGSEDLKEWRELNARWFQFGTFVPLFRVHGQYPFREVYNIAPESHPAYKTILNYNKLRYRLMPYIYSLAGWTYTKDYTIMRGLAMDFTEDTNVYNIGDQYMFGPSIMVAPVHEYKTRAREVYFPQAAGWYDAYTGKKYGAGQAENIDAPYEKMPLFVKAGSILPVGPEIQYTDEKPEAPITLLVYAGEDASFDLYEDEGTNYDYEKGKHTNISIQWSEKNKQLTIGKRAGAYDTMVQERQFNIVLVDGNKSVNLLNPKWQVNKEVMYKGDEIIVKL